MTKFDRLNHGQIQQTWVYRDDDDVEYALKRSEDVTSLVRELVHAYKASVAANEKLTKELREIKTRKWWDELDLATDARTGNTVVVRTHYQLEMKQMRLEISPEVMMYQRPVIDPLTDRRAAGSE